MSEQKFKKANDPVIRFRGGSEVPTYNDQQKLMLAILAMHILSRDWVLPLTFPAPDRFMSKLILAVYSCALAGKPLTKRAAWRQTGLEDIKTARKYIAEAQEERWIKVVPSPEDRRRELLIPSEKLRWHVAYDLHHFGSEVRELINAFLQFPLPKPDFLNPAPLGRTARDSSPDVIVTRFLKWVDQSATATFDEREKQHKKQVREKKNFLLKWRAARVSGGS
jgi:hypothetical protein